MNAFLSTLPSPSRHKPQGDRPVEADEMETLDLGKVGRIVRKMRSQDSSDDADGEDGDGSFSEDARTANPSVTSGPPKSSIAEQKADDAHIDSRPIRRARDVLDTEEFKGEAKRSSIVEDMITKRAPIVLDDEQEVDFAVK